MKMSTRESRECAEMPDWRNLEPYVANVPDEIQLSERFKSNIEAALAERTALRAARSWAAADAIFAKLAKLGVLIDDRARSWAMKPGKKQQAAEENEVCAHICTYCGACFSSRNLLFAHLRDAKTKCGAGVADKGGIDQPPSVDRAAAKRAVHAQQMQARRQQKKGRARARRERHTGRTAVHAAAECCCWFGDIPLAWSFQKRLELMLFALSPRGVHPKPWVKRIVRKAYRARAQNSAHSIRSKCAGGEGDTEDASVQRVEGEQLGYAIVVYRDRSEAALVREAMNGLLISTSAVYGANANSSGALPAVPAELSDHPGFVLRVKRCEHSDIIPRGRLGEALPAHLGIDPPLEDQLSPLSEDELRVRAASLGCAHELPSRGAPQCRTAALAAVAAAYRAQPRLERHVTGCPLPKELSERLLACLCALRWPAQNERQGLSAERYLVLRSSARSNDQHFSGLRALCAELMQFVDPSYRYSSIAVTKNFVASPHIDERDRTHQYAISLGTFRGGELCVDEGLSFEGVEDNCASISSAAVATAVMAHSHTVAIVDTRNRVARVDGRHVHWVRTFTSGDRYSLIFFDTTEHNPTPIGAAVDAEWRPYGDMK